MKRILMLLSTLLAILLIAAGCVSIPLTDGGSIEISGDGVTIITAEDDGGDADTEEGGVGKESVEKVKGSTTDEEESVAEEDDGESENPVTNNDIEEDDSTDFVGGEGLGGCAHEFYLLKNRLPKGFPIPECAYITSFAIVEDREDDSRAIAAQYNNFGTPQEAQESLKAFFAEHGYKFSENGVGVLSAEKNGIEITITNEENGSDSLITGIKYIETPVVNYKVTDSFLNLTEKGHGKCSDEYYTSLSLLPEDFPLAECARTLFLEIDAFDTSKNSAAFYEVDGMWADHFNEIVAYAEGNNFTINQIKGVATQGDLNYTDGGTTVHISIQKIDNTKSDIQINVTSNF